MNNNQMNFDPQTGQPIYVNQTNITDKKELKRIKKEENKKTLKAREIIGTNYLVTLILINIPPALFLEYLLKDNLFLQIILSCLWYITLPLVGAYLIVKLNFKKLKNYITSSNYKKIKKYAIIDLIALGFLYNAIFNVGDVPIILSLSSFISYVGSCFYLIAQMDKISKEVLGGGKYEQSN